jgi:hypothetical protein
MDIRIRTDIFHHPKFLRLCEKANREAGLGLLQLWGWAAVFRPNGSLLGLRNVEIASAAGYPEEGADRFCEALRWSGEWNGIELSAWLESDGTLHDWSKEQAWASGVEDRREWGRQMAAAKWAKRKRIDENAPAKVDPVRKPGNTDKPEPEPPMPVAATGKHHTVAVMLTDEYRQLHAGWFPSAHPTPALTARWRTACEAMLDAGRTVEQIRAAWEAVRDDEFWRENVTGLDILREKWNNGRLDAVIGRIRSGSAAIKRPAPWEGVATPVPEPET